MPDELPEEEGPPLETAERDGERPDEAPPGDGGAAELVDRELRYAVVFYGTNRQRGTACRGVGEVWASAGSGCRPDRFYGAEPGDLEVGTLRVTFPPDHQTGKVERPFEIFGIRFRDEDPDKDVVLAEVRSYGDDYDAWTAELRATGRRSAFVYVHGFATTFAVAARRAAQIAYDVDFAGLPMLYSWPSEGGTLDYFRDYEVVRLVEPFKRFLRLVAERGDLDELHVVAHSMGNQHVAKALHEMALAEEELPALAELILAAPDVDASEFRDTFAASLPRLFRKVTVYVSDRDRALDKSRELRDRPRAGQPDGGLLQARLPGIQVIDASGLRTDFLSHSYYANNDSVRADLHCLMTTGTGAMQRPLLEFVDPSWRFRPRDVLAGLDADDCGRLVEGRQGAPPARTPAPVPAEQVAEGGGGPGLLIPGVALAVLVLLAAVWFVRRRSAG